jgi:hypothetical protein
MIYEIIDNLEVEVSKLIEETCALKEKVADLEWNLAQSKKIHLEDEAAWKQQVSQQEQIAKMNYDLFLAEKTKREAFVKKLENLLIEKTNWMGLSEYQKMSEVLLEQKFLSPSFEEYKLSKKD